MCSGPNQKWVTSDGGSLLLNYSSKSSLLAIKQAVKPFWRINIFVILLLYWEELIFNVACLYMIFFLKECLFLVLSCLSERKG